MPIQNVPTSEFRAKMVDYLAKVTEEKTTLIITAKDRPKAVVLSIAEYDKMKRDHLELTREIVELKRKHGQR